MKNYVLGFSVLLNAVLVWKVGSDAVRSHDSVRGSNFTPDPAAQYADGFAVERRNERTGLLGAKPSSETSVAVAATTAGAGKPAARKSADVSDPNEEPHRRWEERVASGFQNDLRLTTKDVERYQAIRFGYQRELADYVAQHAQPGSEYFVPTLEDQRAMMAIKEKHAQQIRQALGEENFAAYQQMLKDFNAGNARNAARSPASELAIIEL